MDVAGYSRSPQRHNTFHGLLTSATEAGPNDTVRALTAVGDLGVFETVPVSPTSLYHEYVLTEMGRQLFPVVTALRQWGGEYLFEPSEPRQCLVDRRTQAPVAPVQVHSVDGQVVLPEDTELAIRQPDGTNQ
jgi:DNA-binding HxlR family transcriptional regulator